MLMFSKPVKGTAKKKTTMNWWEYWIGHCWMTGWQTISMSFRNWQDLMTGNYEGYALMFYDDPYEECYNTFWDYLGDDDVLPKEFLEGLLEMSARIERGEEKLIPFTREMFDNIDDLVGDFIDDLTLDEMLENEEPT
jgi:hypothetical protein